MRGPIDYIIVGFSENNFSGRILEELGKASENGTIAVLEVALIARDTEGSVAMVEISDPLVAALGSGSGLIDPEDVVEVGELLEDGTSAGLLVIEHLWAKGLKQAIIDTGGQLLSEGRIHPEASKELEGAE